MSDEKRESIKEYQRHLYGWLDQSFVCNLFKPDLCLGWFFVYVRNTLEADPATFEAVVDRHTGDLELRQTIKRGYARFRAFLHFCRELVPDTYNDLAEASKLAINEQLAEGLLESTRQILTGLDPDSLEEDLNCRRGMKWRLKRYRGIGVHVPNRD